jgi:hypothetical protein
MLSECDASLDDLDRLLTGYQFFYVDDIVGQRRPFGSALGSLRELRWTCNVFAIPRTDGHRRRCAEAFDRSRKILRQFS